MAWRLSVGLAATSVEVTTLAFIQRLAEVDDATAIGPGWHDYLDRLAAAVADEPVPEDFDPYVADLAGAYPLTG